MSRACYQTRHEGSVFLVAILSCLLLLTAGAEETRAATICDKAPAVKFRPTVDPTLLNAVLDTLGAIRVTRTSSTSVSLLYGHTLYVTLNSLINIGGADFVVTPGFGSLEVELAIPGWSTNLSTSMSHAACRNCGTELSTCQSGCNSSYNSCVNSCVNNPSFPCYGVRLCCETGCAPALGTCLTGCGGAFLLCEPDQLACEAERAAINTLLSGHRFGMSFSSASVTQTADICVTGDCNVANPEETTVASLSGFTLHLFPTGDPLGIGSWLNGIISGLVNWALNIQSQIASFFVTPEGEGVLILPFALDIASDGCLPVQEVTDCAGGGCSTVNRQAGAVGRGANLLFYGLPVAFLAGLLLWRRKR